VALVSVRHFLEKVGESAIPVELGLPLGARDISNGFAPARILKNQKFG
jgi:hypothetical protein